MPIGNESIKQTINSLSVSSRPPSSCVWKLSFLFLELLDVCSEFSKQIIFFPNHFFEIFSATPFSIILVSPYSISFFNVSFPFFTATT